ncbi:MAG: hypothetical protein GWN17_02125 [Candidatus Korarchaeota archaeon]|nr:hypothetical protein [Candidatus Thorarchaeota archaeon]NIW51020.1 hypothetical protein [Candidatus Korarchaeota archaeon]
MRARNDVNTRKVFVFFKDERDIVGKTRMAMENLKRTHRQVTLDLIASRAGLPPKEIHEAAYALAPELDLLIGMKESLHVRYA